MTRFIICCSLSFFSLSMPFPGEASVKSFVQTDPTYATHKVVAGETLSSISRKYGVPLKELSELNPAAKSGLKIGQLLRIPNKNTAETTITKTTPGKAATTKPEPTKPQPAPAGNAAAASGGQEIHKVAPGESLYSIAIKHKVTMAEIRKWNNLKSDALKPGQTLKVSGGETAPVVAAPATTPAKIETETDKTVVTKTEVKTKPGKVKTETKTETVKAEPTKTVTAEENEAEDEKTETSSVESAGKVTETGMAEVIPQVGENDKFLALHKTAPVGSLLQVKNIMNGQIVYVRVIGKLPDTGANEKVIVRISKKAFQRLAAIDNRFRVEVSYMP